MNSPAGDLIISESQRALAGGMEFMGAQPDDAKTLAPYALMGLTQARPKASSSKKTPASTPKKSVSQGEGVQITLKRTPGMDSNDFSRKVRALQDLAKRGELSKSIVGKRGNAAREYRSSLLSSAKEAWGKSDPERLKRFEKRLQKMDVDHVQDLQIGGKDVLSNLKMLDSPVNRSLGPQIKNQLKNVPEGTKITGVNIIDGTK